ncbi:translin-associated factor X-interacting protein 1 isoform X5 [Homo sapiens]|uniref:translin-associated factor X-interacting protein 1 isoform X5 n=1 Tax=Homo sapiens TaxID=9606 RepID=UPI0005D01A01|nr:translin-associated factor X-interacting protein 1 isoform X5 [Homo sapiens]XP_054169452.1 translin-associated factor X-interacting protein 1 isoform X5 [Homo sapiens]|eukprot:XP_011521536.1 translin-associated factor X-interacting protein 1 isoform X5 [Homo sapiens]
MACQQSRYHSFSSASRLQPRPSGVTIDESFLTEDKSTQNRKLLQKRRTLTGQFSMGGHLSPWPTYTSGQTILQNRKPCSDDYRKRVGSCQQHPFRTAKPQYLEELENYLRKELLLLDLGTDSTQELRLQPYREIFEFFIEDFKTYKPLLSSIKNAYEGMLAHQREKIRALEPLKAKLVTVNEDCNERILAMRAEEKYEISLLKKEKMNLLKLIDKKNEEKISLQSEVTKLRKNLAEEYLHYLSERDACKILIADLNELRYQREDMSLAQSPGIWGEDPVKLTLALKMTRQDLTRTQMELNNMKANFGDVVPRRDFEMQEKTNKDLQEQEIQRTSTPRPDWTKCKGEGSRQGPRSCLHVGPDSSSLSPHADVVAGGPERWQMLAEGKNSDQLVDVLLEEIGSGLLREKDFFPGLGYGEAIPAFLRFDGLVENKKPSKKDVVNLLKDAWKERLAEEQKETFPDFFFNFLEHRFGPSDAMAWAYTIFENIKIFHSNEVMSQFYAVLMGKRSENVYVTQKETVAQLLKEMTNADSQNEGLLTMEQFNTVLKSTFPLKTEEQIQELMEAGGWHPSSSNADLLNYRSLFMEDEEGQSEPFVQKLWEQYMDEKDEYLQQLKQELGIELHEEVTLPKLRGGLMTIDPSLDKQTVNTYMSQAFQLPESEMPEEGDEKEEAVVEILQTALERLQVIDIRRVGPREPEPAS